MAPIHYLFGVKRKILPSKSKFMRKKILIVIESLSGGGQRRYSPRL